MGEWAPVPEQQKESVLRAQQVEKYLDWVYAMYRHFNKDRVEVLEELPLYIDDPARENFDRRLRIALARPGDGSLRNVSFLAAICGVHKSTISRYINAHGFEIEGVPLSQNEMLRHKRHRAMFELFEACRDNGGDFSKLGPIIGLLDGQKTDLGITSMFQTPTSSYGVILGYWMGDQPKEVQDRVYRDLGKDPAKEHAFIHNLTKAFLEMPEVDA